MKVTAIIDDDMINEAIKFSNAKTITAALKTALEEYIHTQKIKEAIQDLKENGPLEFAYTAEEIRELNRGNI